ncbi:MAG TPA: DUF262 domain-containing protein [Gammaproteobacteria bacterium]|nr:DUF262 domain-containing protein [Gammaproteobacteria bacterium]
MPLDEEISLNDDDILDDVSTADYSSVVYSRDWLIETFIEQIRKNNIDLNQKFNRRNAWDDVKRSRLIESLIIGLPVPEIILAEKYPQSYSEKSFFIIDGKQRLSTIAGFVMPDSHQSWDNAQLEQLKVRRELNGLTYKQLEAECFDEHRLFLEANIKCTIISEYQSDDVLYDLFSRRNSSVCTQALRQVLHNGPFANYLIDITNELQPIHQVLGLNQPDNTFFDIEIILRVIALVLFGQQDYQGNIKVFLDKAMAKMTQYWQHYEEKVKTCYHAFNEAINRLSKIFLIQEIGRPLTVDKSDHFNKRLFEVQIYYFMSLNDDDITAQSKENFLSAFKVLCHDPTFQASLASSTQTLAHYRVRFESFNKLINAAFHKEINQFPIKASS